MSSLNTLVDELRRQAAEQPDQTVLSFLDSDSLPEAHFTFAELDRQAQTIAAALQHLDTFQQRVLLIYLPGLDFIAGLFGCLYAGAVAVPAYPPRLNRPLPRLRSIVKNAAPTVVLTTTSIQSRIERRLPQMPDLAALSWLSTDDGLQMNGPQQAHQADLSQLQANAWQRPDINQDNLAFLQYTSGSTAEPKGVMLSHHHLLTNLRLTQQVSGVNSDSRGVFWLPLYHDMGLIGAVLQTIAIGAQGTFMSPMTFLQRPLTWLEVVSRTQATVSGGPNFAYDLCLHRISEAERATLDLSHWRLAFNSAEPVRPETIAAFSTAFATCGFRPEAFYPCYGLAEATLLVTGGAVDRQPVIRSVQAAALAQHQVVPAAHDAAGTRQLVGCGQALAGQAVMIVDPEAHTPCAPDQVGEIWVSGPSVASGYWNHSAQTQETFRAYVTGADGLDGTAGPFLRTGDLGFLQDGELFITGRLKDLIIIRGRNHYPQDIEYTIHHYHPALEANRSAAFTVPVDEDERLIIVQEVKRTYLSRLNEAGMVDEIITAINQAVTEQHELQTYAVLLLKPKTIPETSSGKIRRHARRDDFLNGTLNVIGSGGLYQMREEWLTYQKIKLSKTVQHKTGTNMTTVQLEAQKIDRPDKQNNQISIEQPSAQSHTYLAHLSEAGLDERRRLLRTYIQEQIAAALEIKPGQIDIEKSLTSLGLDSLAAVELRNRVMSDLAINIPIEKVADGPSIVQLTEFLLGQIALVSIVASHDSADDQNDELEEIII